MTAYLSWVVGLTGFGAAVGFFFVRDASFALYGGVVGFGLAAIAVAFDLIESSARRAK